MNITVLGATGKTGHEVARLALSAGHEVTVLVRDPAKLTLNGPSLTVVTGDARQPADVAKALVGSDAVISTLGSMKAADRLLADASKAIVSAATDAGVSRVVLLSSFLLAPNYRPNLMAKVIGAMTKGIVADKTVGEETLTRSPLTWTIVYATRLDKAKPGTSVRVVPTAESVSLSDGIARTDVADFLIREVTGAGHPRAKVTITAN